MAATTSSTNASTFTQELRVDPSDGQPYTHQSFIDTYVNGQELWDRAKVWGGDGVLRIRTCDSGSALPLPPSIQEVPSPTPEFVRCENDFPVGPMRSPERSPTSTVHGRFHYSRAVESESSSGTPSPRASLSPDAAEWTPQGAASGGSNYNYSPDTQTTNEEFSQLAADLWLGSETFPQPPEDIESLNIDWGTAIQDWSPEQWREFGIKYFYGYVQQSSLLLEQLNEKNCEEGDHESPVENWGNE